MNKTGNDGRLTHKLLIEMLVDKSGETKNICSRNHVAQILGMHERSVRRYMKKEADDKVGAKLHVFLHEEETGALTNSLEDMIKRGYSVQDICKYLQERTNCDFQQKIEQLYDSWKQEEKVNKEGLKNFALGLLNIAETSYISAKALETGQFFKMYLKEYAGNIEYIGMAFHSGMAWFHDEDKKRILNKIIKERIPLHILVNTSDVINPMAFSLRSPDQEYETFEECLKKWKEIARKNDFITVRTASTPIIHRMYFVSTKDSKGIMNFRIYRIGNHEPEKDQRYNYLFGEENFEWYKNEWKYSWENALEDD